MNLKAEDTVYLTTINVPESHLIVQSVSTFVEIRAQFIHADEGKPVFFVDINNLNLIQCSNIIWNKFQPFIEELVRIHFNTIMK